MRDANDAMIADAKSYPVLVGSTQLFGDFLKMLAWSHTVRHKVANSVFDVLR